MIIVWIFAVIGFFTSAVIAYIFGEEFISKRSSGSKSERRILASPKDLPPIQFYKLDTFKTYYLFDNCQNKRRVFVKINIKTGDRWTYRVHIVATPTTGTLYYMNWIFDKLDKINALQQTSYEQERWMHPHICKEIQKYIQNDKETFLPFRERQQKAKNRGNNVLGFPISGTIPDIPQQDYTPSN